MIERRIPYYALEDLSFSDIRATDFLKDTFVLRLPKLPKEPTQTVLLDVGDCLRCELLFRSEEDTDDIARAMRQDNGFYYRAGGEWAIVTTFVMRRRHSEARETFYLVLPFSMPCLKETDLYLYFDGVFLKYLSSDAVLNENAGQDLFAATDAMRVCAGAAVTSETPPSLFRYEKDERNADFYSPLPYNVHVGDVMNFYHDGVYHLLYLMDRRHHGSRNGAGAHYIMHVTTRDFENWREEEPVVTLDVPYESHGTGTMLYHNGKYYMSYGLHTERYIDDNGLGLLSYEEDGTLAREKAEEEFLQKGLFPAGATYAVSEDGVHFEKSRALFHVGRNPSVYTNEKGGISLYIGYDGKGTWESDGFGKPFRQIDENFPPILTLPMRQTGECPSFFSMNGYRYLIMGFTGYFRTLTPQSETYTDVSALGEEIYDGLCVPMVASVGDRRIISGWLDGTGWGSVAVHRELLCLENGRLGMRWVPKLLPALREENIFAETNGTCPLPKEESYLFSCTATVRGGGKLALVFADEKGMGVEISLDGAIKRMQAADAVAEGFAERIPSMVEQFRACDDAIDYYGHTGCKDIPRYSVNFSVAAPDMDEEPFSLRILSRYSRKLRSTVLDVEVGGVQTMITVRRGLFPVKMEMRTSGDVSLRDQRLARTQYSAD